MDIDIVKYQLEIHWRSGRVDIAEHGRHFTRSEGWDYIEAIDPEEANAMSCIKWRKVK